MTHRFSMMTALLFLLGCPTTADKLGVGAECGGNDDCPTFIAPDGQEEEMECLTQFAGGYCGIEGCEDSAQCPEGAICVAHDDGNNYCFRVCLDKSECNANRTADNESNCSANFNWAEPADEEGQKACIPPSSGD